MKYDKDTRYLHYGEQIRMCNTCKYVKIPSSQKPCCVCDQTTTPLEPAEKVVILETEYIRADKAQKTGEWIDQKYSGEGFNPGERFVCSECGAKENITSRFCPECGSLNEGEEK